MKHTIIIRFLLIIGMQPFNLDAITLFVGKQEKFSALQQALDLDYRSLQELEDAYWTATESKEKIFGSTVKLELVLLGKNNKEIVLKPAYSSQHFYLGHPFQLQAAIDELDINQTSRIIFKVSYAEMSMPGLIYYGEIFQIQ
ncbi:MAG: hypothetical protein JW822_03365 [Spirochaetales bacterium]|nr:hypothetical protein [Spirochaetales bacterium]